MIQDLCLAKIQIHRQFTLYIASNIKHFLWIRLTNIQHSPNMPILDQLPSQFSKRKSSQYAISDFCTNQAYRQIYICITGILKPFLRTKVEFLEEKLVHNWYYHIFNGLFFNFAPFLACSTEEITKAN